MTTRTLYVELNNSIKIVQVEDKVIALCTVKAAHVHHLTIEEVESLSNWCGHQTAELWEGLTLQEILNVYRASAEWDTWEGWVEEDWEAAYDAWDACIDRPEHKMDRTLRSA